MAESFTYSNLMRVLKVPGFENRTNDLVYGRPRKALEKCNVVIFFGGDVQNFTEKMLKHRDNKKYIKSNLENTAYVMQNKFVNSHIIIVRPSRMINETFSCFDNFVHSFHGGIPEHSETHQGLEHLELLIYNLCQRLNSMTDQEMREAMKLSINALIYNDSFEQSKNIVENYERPKIDLENCDIKIIGFSKGCIVLNQFLHEFQHAKMIDSKCKIIPKIKDMYWLDGGHPGNKDTWITSEPLLKILANSRIRIHVHVTPFQVKNNDKPWVRREEKLFSDTLKTLGAQIHRVNYFEHCPVSIKIHFDILWYFTEDEYL